MAGSGRAAAAEEVAARIGELGLRTVRLAVVDQHGIPRGKMMSPEAAIAAMSDGLDFSGAIYSLDTGNQVFVPAFAAGGGFGIDELTGFPDVVLVPDPSTFQVLPWADRTGWMLTDVFREAPGPRYPHKGPVKSTLQFESLLAKPMEKVAEPVPTLVSVRL